MSKKIFLIVLFFIYSCEDSCQNYEKIDSGDRCVVVRGLNDLNKERAQKKLKPLICHREKIKGLELELSPAKTPDIDELKYIDPYRFVRLEGKDSAYLAKGYCSHVYTVQKKGTKTVEALKYKKGRCSHYSKDIAFLDLMCAVSDNPIKSELLSHNLMLTTFVRGKSLDRHIKSGDFFANKDGMKEAMRLLLAKMVNASVLYRDIHPYNIVFDQNNKVWAIIDTHYPLMFDSPTIALKYMKRTNPWSKYYGSEVKKKIRKFLASINN